MKPLSNIAISFTTLILLVFGAGGIGISKCACTGKVSFILPFEQDCCPVESDCMTVTVMHFSASELQQANDVPQPHPMLLAITPTVPLSEYCLEPVVIPVVQSPPPPSGFVETTVLRV